MKVWRGIFVLCVGVGSWSMAAVDLKEAEITTIKNIVEHDPGTGAAPAKVNEKIHEKSKVSTAASSMAELTFADSSITRMGANTQFSFRSKERLVKLDQGTILIHTPPGNGGATVEAGGVTAAVSGTTFMASRDGVGNVLFVLLEGQGGLKVTAGGSSTVIRPGQAASVGADSVKESPGVASSEKGPAAPAAGPSASPGEEKGPGGSPATGGGDSGGTPPPASPKIQVFDIDVKRVVTTSPLVMDFQGELPSASKIEKTIETQQQAVKEGKLEKLEVEAVAVKSTDGDLLVGAPKVEKEEFVVVNKKLDIVGKSTGGDGLDIDTAAGPGAGSGTGGGVAAAPAPRVETPTAPPTVTPPVNPGQTALQPPPAATTVAVTARVNDASRPFGQDNPSFGFSLTSGSLLAGHSLVTDFLTSATRSSGVSASPFAVNFSNPKIVDSSGADVTSRYDLTTLPGVLNVVKAGQSVTFGSVGSLTFGQSVDLVGSALGGAVNYEVVSGPGTVVDGKLVATSGTGEVVIRASTPGNENYLGAAAEQTITLAKAGQSVNFGSVGGVTFGQSVDLVGSALGGAVNYEVVSGPATVVNGKLVANSGTGTVQVRAVTSGNENYLGADAVQTITLVKAGQSVNFGSVGGVTFGQSVDLVGSALGGAVNYEVVSGPATVVDGKLVANSGTGDVVIRASTPGNENYLGADAVQTITLAKAGQSVNFGSVGGVTFGQSVDLVGSALGGAVNYEVVSGPATVVDGKLVATSGTGEVVVRASTPGNENYLGADAVQTITLAKANQNLGIDLVPYVLPGITPPSFVATATGAQTGSTSVSIQEVDGRASLDALTGQIAVGKVLGADSFTLLATAAGDDNFNFAQATRRVDINVDAAALDAANPARRLLTGPGSSAELEALDKFFYYTAKAADYAGDAPSGFFATDHQSKNLTFGQVESARLSQLYAGQTSDYFFMGNLNAGNVGVPEMNLQGRDRIIYADTVRIDPTVGADRTLGETFSKGPAIPDGNPAGLARTLDLSSRGLTGSFSWFVDQVSLRIDGDPMAYGAFNGDFNSYLRHTKSSGETATVDLLDRMGSTVTEPEGSASNGLDVTFRDFASTAIHDADSAQAGGAIEGTYQPDRGVNPLTAGIGPVDPSGQFTLAVFDASSGAEGVLHSWSIDLVERFAISLENGAAKSFVLAAGDGGLFVKNTFWDLGGTRAEFTTTGNLSLQSDSFFFPGSSLKMEAAGSAELADVGVLGNPTAGSEVVIRARQDVTLTDTAIHEVGGQIEVASLNGAVELLASKTIGTQTVSGNVDLQAEGKIKITGATPVEIDTSAGVGSGGTSGPAAGNLAVVRSGDSLELRNVVIRGFSGARLENNAGRVLMSGSSVRDFKIKELTGMAVNADAKIQMAAYDSAGKLEGEMVVENHLPVAKASVAASTSLQAKLGSTELAEIMNDPQRRDVQLDAGQVDLAARKITFDNASVAALNSITARANTILIQNSFMTVVQNSGMINMYVSSGLVNQNYGTMVDGRVNFAGLNTFTIGNNSFAIGNQTQLNSAYGTNLIEIPNGGTPQAGKVNVLKL